MVTSYILLSNANKFLATIIILCGFYLFFLYCKKPHSLRDINPISFILLTINWQMKSDNIFLLIYISMPLIFIC